jgi:iron complex outermembrane recepter protein
MKNSVSRLLLFMLFSICTHFAYSQGGRVVTGQVRDTTGTPIPGVSVTIRGTKVGTSTDVNGNFRLTGVPENASVVSISGVGFNNQDVTVSSTNTVTATLTASSSSLSEVVVTGFGTRTPTRKLGYSIQEVRGADLAKANTPNVVNALQGKVAGVMVNQGSGGPTSASRIRIRGNTSLQSNTQPLVVIDGVLIRPGTSGADSWGSAQDFGNQINNLNVDDYESVTVLKGSAASALYGSEAQNGVLLITTKKGTARKGLGVTVSHTQTFETAYKSVETQDLYGGGINPTFTKGADGVDEIDRANATWSFGPRFDGHMVRDVDGRMIPWSANNDLLAIYETGRFSNTNVSIESGNERTTFRLSYTNTGSKSIFPNNKLTRHNVAIRATQKLSNFINIDASINYNDSKGYNPIRQGGNDNPVFAQVYFSPRHLDINYWKNHYMDSLGGQLRGAYNNYGMAGIFYSMNNNSVVQNDKTFRANIDVNATITSWLNLLVRGNINNVTTDRETKNWGTGQNFTGGSYGLLFQTQNAMRLQGLLSTNRKINDNLEFSFSAGGETNRDLGGKFSNTNTEGGLRIPLKFYFGNSLNPISNQTRLLPQKRIDALYAFGDITFRDMLTLSVSGRNDWSSSLTYPSGGGNNSYFYPSAGLSWVFSELLTSNPKFDFLSFGKVRASIGYTGIDARPYETSTGNYSPLGTFNDVTGVISRYGFADNTIGNLNLKNELTREIEVGADMRFLDNRFGFDIAFYKKNSFNQILALSVPSESGVTSRLINAGNIQNQGVELILSTTPIRNKDFEWNANFNFSRNKNKIVELAPGVTSRTLDLAFGADVESVARVGADYGTIQTGYAYAYYQKKDANGNNIDHPSNGRKLLRPTNFAFYRSQDIGQGVRQLGTMMEKFLLSTIQNFRYKNITAGFQIDSKVGGLMASATHQYGSTNGSLKSTLFGRDASTGGLPYTTPAGVKREDGIIPDGVFPDGAVLNNPATSQPVDVGGKSYQDAVTMGLLQPLSARLYYARLTQWSSGIREYSVFENSWVALREVSVGYTVPKRFSDKMRFNSIRVSLVGRNLMYLYTTTPDDINPESIFSNRSGTFAEYGGIPYVRGLGFTVNAGL